MSKLVKDLRVQADNVFHPSGQCTKAVKTIELRVKALLPRSVVIGLFLIIRDTNVSTIRPARSSNFVADINLWNKF